MIFFSISQLMPIRNFRCVLKERTVVLLCKYVKFCFGSYRLKIKPVLNTEKILYQLLASPLHYVLWLFFCHWYTNASVSFCYCCYSDKLCCSSLVVFCSADWVHSPTWAEVLCVLSLPKSRRAFMMFLFSTSFHSGESLPPSLISQTSIFLSSGFNSSFVLGKDSSCGL